MYVGLGIFGIAAILCIFVGAVAIKRNRDYGESDGGDDDDFDFDAYEGFDKP